MNYNQRREVIDKLNHLEATFPVEQWQLGGIQIWPIIKVKVFFMVFATINTPEQNTYDRGRLGFTTKLKTRLQRLANAIAYFMRLELPKADFLFSGATSHRVDLDGELVNRYFDPMMDYLESKNKHCVGVEYDSDQRPIPYEKFDDLIPLFRPPRIGISDLTANSNFKEFSIKMETMLGVREKELTSVVINTVKSVLQWKRLFLYAFKKIEPKYCFGLCYYSAAMWGMNAAAREVGVVSVDMQHGTQGILHVAYSLTKWPSKGSYDILPNEFWCWDEISYRHLQSLLVNSNHRAKLSGNPWYEFFDSKKIKSPVVAPSSKPMILLTLQPTQPILNDYIVQTIQKTSSDFSWWLRLHPRFSSSDKAILMQTLKDNALIRSVEVEKATSIALPELLMRSALHISKFSGSIIEAAEVGVFSVILEQIGIETFKTIIEEGDAIGIEEPSVEALVLTIKNSIGKKSASRSKGSFKVLLDAVC